MKTFGLIGFPVSHSFSGTYFNARFSVLGLKNYNYNLFPLKSLATLIDLIKKEKNLAGFNVTVPHKTTIINYLHHIESDAKKIGAVNTVKIERKGKIVRLIGYNTDWLGFEKSLVRFLKNLIDLETKNMYRKKRINALILGTGGSAKAVGYSLSRLGIPFNFVSRKPSSRKILNYSELNKENIAKTQLIINTTPVGMFPEINVTPEIPYHFISEKHYVFDLIYNPEETIFLKNASLQGAKIKNGFEMLIFQAEKAGEIWGV